MYSLMSPAGWRCRPGTAICENSQSVSLPATRLWKHFSVQLPTSQLTKNNNLKFNRAFFSPLDYPLTQRSLVERIDLCGSLAKEKLDILHLESREDWIGQPWGAKHHQSTSGRVSIIQRMTLTTKRLSRNKSDELTNSHKKARSQYQQQSLTYVFETPESDFTLMDDKAISDFLDEIKQLRSITFQPAELVKRKASSLRIKVIKFPFIFKTIIRNLFVYYFLFFFVVV